MSRYKTALYGHLLHEEARVALFGIEPEGMDISVRGYQVRYLSKYDLRDMEEWTLYTQFSGWHVMTTRTEPISYGWSTQSKKPVSPEIKVRATYLDENDIKLWQAFNGNLLRDEYLVATERGLVALLVAPENSTGLFVAENDPKYPPALDEHILRYARATRENYLSSIEGGSRVREEVEEERAKRSGRSKEQV